MPVSVYQQVLDVPEIMRDQYLRALDHHMALVEEAMAQGDPFPNGRPECVEAHDRVMGLRMYVDWQDTVRRN